MTITQILKLVRGKLLETTEEIIDNETLLTYANMRKDDISRRFLANKLIKPAILSFSNGVAVKPADWNGHHMSADSNQPGQGSEFILASLKDFQAGIYPNMITESEDGDILVYPNSIASLYTWYFKKLPDMQLTPTLIDFPTSFDTAFYKPLMYGVLADAFEDIQDFELAKIYDDKYELELLKASQSLSTLEESSLGVSELIRPLPDLNFSTGGINSNPNYW